MKTFKKRFLKSALIFGAVLLMGYCIRKIVITPIYNLILPYFLTNNDITASILLSRLCDLFSLLISVIIIPLLRKIINLYVAAKKSASSILIYSKKAHNISGIKKNSFNRKCLCVDLRTNQKAYRVIYAVIENTGNNSIIELLLDEKHIPIYLKGGEEKDLSILIDAVLDKRSTNSNSIKWGIKFQDNLNRFYSMKYLISVDLNNLQANFVVDQKTKRIRR